MLQFVGCFAKFVTEKEVARQAITEEMVVINLDSFLLHENIFLWEESFPLKTKGKLKERYNFVSVNVPIQ